MVNQRTRMVAEAAYLASLQVTSKNYQSIVDNNDYLGSLREHKYRFIEARDNKKDGFYAIALSSCNQELLIAFRGTDFYNFKFLSLALPIVNLAAQVITDDLYSDLQVALGKVPKQYRSAEAFIESLSKNYLYNKMIITGHSLGALLAQLIAAKFGIESIVFDSPGAKKILRKLDGGEVGKTSTKITIINDLPNFINTCGEHIVVPIAINNGGALSLNLIRNFLGTMPHKAGRKARCLCCHGMEDILNSIDKDGSYKTIPIKSWPKNCISFYKSMKAYNAMPDIYDAYIYEMWRRQSRRHLFRSRYPSFDLYRKDFIKNKLRSD